MTEKPRIEEDLRALDVSFPETPPLAVGDEIRRWEAATASPPRVTLLPRRRALVLVAAGVLLLLAATAVAVRLGIGAFSIRIGPPVTESPGLPESGSLGEPVSLDDARRAAGFTVRVPPSLGPPDGAFLAKTLIEGRPLVALAWRPSDRLPVIHGTDWGAILVQTAAPAAVAVKEAGAAQVSFTRVAGHEAVWISGPHDLVLRAPGGGVRLEVSGNVLIWERDGISLRLETALGRSAAISVAESVP
jgi:hypothetical protein